jgi:signal transduction histidine kinase
MMKSAPLELAHDEDVPALIANMPASAQHRRIAFGVVIVLSVAFAASMPFVTIPGPRIDAFLSATQTVVLFADIITAIFLFAQFSIQPQRALLALASGYMFSGLFAFLQTLDFPGAYSATGVITGTPSGAVWFLFFWRTTFPLAVIAYVLLKDAKETAGGLAAPETGRAIGVTIASVIAATAGLTWLLATGYLPNLYIDATRQAPLVNQLAGATWSLNAMAVVLLFIRMRTILDVWLIVAVFVSLPDLSLAVFYAITIRFSVGWYIGKTYLLIGSWTVLVVLLWETMMLYARLASAMILQRRERAHRIMSVDEATAAIAHELRQPLGALTLNSDSALEFLNTTPLDAEGLRSCLVDLKSDSSRANETIASVRALFKETVRQKSMTDINRLVQDVLNLAENDLRIHGVLVETDLQEDVPHVMADVIQLQQVILNLVKNAIEAMESGLPSRRAIRLVTTRRGNSVVSLQIRDLGHGMTSEAETRAFDPFFTTKVSGTGLGLSISRRIIEDHGGELRLLEASSSGTTFELTLPAAGTDMQVLAGSRPLGQEGPP